MTTTTTPTVHRNSTPVMASARHGALGGLAGGLVFGVLMQMMGMIPMIAQLVGSTSPVVGWLVHLAISVGLGVTFAVLVGDRLHGALALVGAGLVWGVIWWVLGALLAMPLALGMPVAQINETSLMSLMGHLIFGGILGAVVAMTRRH